jgi:hypothetical protein
MLVLQIGRPGLKDELLYELVLMEITESSPEITNHHYLSLMAL